MKKIYYSAIFIFFAACGEGVKSDASANDAASKTVNENEDKPDGTPTGTGTGTATYEVDTTAVNNEGGAASGTSTVKQPSGRTSRDTSNKNKK